MTSIDPDVGLFSCHGHDKKEPLCYTIAGLDDIYLLNGYTREIDEDGDELLSIHDADNLHRAIAHHLAAERARLSPKHLHFLRRFLGLTQEELAQKLHTSAQSVARWEKGQYPMPNDKMGWLRLRVLAIADPNLAVQIALDALNIIIENQAKKEVATPLPFANNGDGWHPATAA